MSEEAALRADLFTALTGSDEELEIRVLLAWNLFDRDELDEAATHADRVLDAVSADHWLAPAGHAVAAYVLVARLDAEHDTALADRAIEHLRAAAATPGAELLPDDLPVLLGWLMLIRVWQTPLSTQPDAAVEEDLSRAIAILQRCAETPGLADESIEEVVALSGLGLAYRHWVFPADDEEAEESDLDTAIPLLVRASAAFPDDAEIADTLRDLKGERYIRSSEHGLEGDPEDLQAAVFCLEESYADPTADLDRDWLNLELADALITQAKRELAPLSGYDRASVLLAEAVERMPTGHPRRLEAVVQLGAHSFVTGVPYTEAAEVRLRRVISSARQELAGPPADPQDEGVLRAILGSALVLHWEGHRADTIQTEAHGELLKALDLLPVEHPLRVHVSQMAGALAYSHSLMTGDLYNVDTARAVFRSLAQPLGRRTLRTDDTDASELEANALAADVWASVTRRDTSHISGMRDNLRRAVRRMSPQARMGSMADNALAITEVLAMAQDGEPTSESAVEDLIARLSAAGRAATLEVERGALSGFVAMLQFMLGVLRRDRTAARQGLSELGEAISTNDLDRLLPGLRLSILGAGHFFSYEHWRDPTDLDLALMHLEQAREQATEDDTTPAHIQRLLILAKAYRHSAISRPSDRQRAVDVGREALLARARGVLLQTGADNGQAAARHGAEDALSIARWCLADRRPGEAVAALELGRGLVLHAATVTADLPTLLRAAGSADLAEQWENSIGVLHEPPLAMPLDDPESLVQLLGASAPSAPRRQVLRALHGTAAETHLLSPPSPQDIGLALRSRGMDALVYLLPPSGDSPGRAVAVWPDGEVSELILHLLDDWPGPIGSYLNVYRSARNSAQDAAERKRTRAAWCGRLRSLCSWAWKAAMSQLIAAARKHGAGREPRLVLVPFGPLSVVPWHAACREGLRNRYACEEAIVSYTASARQFIEAAARPSRPPAEAPVFIVNPTGDLEFAELEATAIRDAYYPGADCLGRSAEALVGHGLPGEVLSRLPSVKGSGASLLHFGCHARAEDTPATSYLLLAGGQPLPIERILTQAAQRRVDGSGALVVLGACESDFSAQDHDEPLTLASAFLAAGAASVVGSRWFVSDGRTALLMFMFHHHLAAGSAPVDALHGAQRWMLDPDRVVPDTMPEELAACVAAFDLTEPYAFAAFTHQGR